MSNLYHFPTLFLQNATDLQLQQAAALNHKELFCTTATANGGEVKSSPGLTYTYNGPGKQGMVAFPVLDDPTAGEALDTMMDFYRSHLPNNVGCWSLDPSQPVDLGIRLLARGFQLGWQPCWMSLDLGKINDNHARPATLEIKADNERPLHQVKGLPYASEDNMLSVAFLTNYPQYVQRFIAILDGNIVAHTSVFFTHGDHGVAGIYNVGVVPEARRQGIGKAVVLAACLYAKQLGYHYALLNGTGRTMYEQLGFRCVGYGSTWWLMSSRYRTHPPAVAEVSMVESIGRGDLEQLGILEKKFSQADLAKPITNGMTLMQLAVHCRQARSAEWLIGKGITFTVLDAWDLGWKDKATAILKSHPEQVNDRYEDCRMTLLHIASERNDIALAQLALEAGADLTIQDKTHHATPLDWAHFFHRKEIVQLIERNRQGLIS